MMKDTIQFFHTFEREKMGGGECGYPAPEYLCSAYVINPSTYFSPLNPLIVSENHMILSNDDTNND